MCSLADLDDMTLAWACSSGDLAAVPPEAAMEYNSAGARAPADGGRDLELARRLAHLHLGLHSNKWLSHVELALPAGREE